MSEWESCVSCDGPCTPDEAEHYDGECETCARKRWERVCRWIAGQPDIELDLIWGAA